jgi:hypothetical protein
MPSSPTPLHRALSSRTPGVRSVLTVSGTVTVLLAASLTRPAAIEAQAVGTMQVVARVTLADAAWDGLAEAQQAARKFAAAQVVNGPRRTDHSLTQIELETAVPAAGAAPQLAISIQHLRN